MCCLISLIFNFRGRTESRVLYSYYYLFKLYTPCSILATQHNLYELVNLHALDAEIPVALVTPPALDSLRLVEASNAGKAV